MTKSELGERLARCRRALGMRAADVGRVLGVHHMTVYRWEWGRANVPIDDLGRLANLFRCHVGWLVGGDGDAPAYVTAFEAATEDDEGEPACQTG